VLLARQAASVIDGGTGRTASRIATGSTLLALASGVVDLWAVTSLGGPFASVVTGNLVIAGEAAGRGAPRAVWPPLIAVLGFALGVAAWSLAWRRHQSIAGPLGSELVVLVALTVTWVLERAAPPHGVGLVLLGLAALAMGGQSSTALRLGESTTYLTGTLTGGVVALVAGGPRARVTALRQLAAVAAGAAAAALLLGIAPSTVPMLAVVLLVAALVTLGRRGITKPSRRRG
jgi:uncharacterized membrane protein YoaK (UPF0700 family)